MRIKRIRETISYPSGDLIKTYLVTWREYLELTTYRQYGHRIDLCPYKFWQVWYIVQVPAYFLLSLLSKNRRWKARKPTQIAASIAMTLIEVSFTFLFTRFVLEKIF